MDYYDETLGVLDPEIRAKWLPFLEACEAGVMRIYILDKLYIIEMPTVTHFDAENRLHHETGPALEFLGEATYHWHGVEVPAFAVVNFDLITPRVIRDENNSEVRRVLIERYGWQRYLRDIGANPVHQDAYGRLFRVPFGDFDRYFVEVLNPTPEPDGTRRAFLLAINPTKYNGDAGRYAHAAVASTWRHPLEPQKLVFEDWRAYVPDYAA